MIHSAKSAYWIWHEDLATLHELIKKEITLYGPVVVSFVAPEDLLLYKQGHLKLRFTIVVVTATLKSSAHGSWSWR